MLSEFARLCQFLSDLSDLGKRNNLKMFQPAGCLAKSFEKEQNPLKLFPFELYGHYNVDGYKKVAETIYKFTKD